MGPALKNLKGLLKMPYGCGEQNMAAFAPNIFLLQYLYNNKMDVSRVLDDALRYMRAGMFFFFFLDKQLNVRCVICVASARERNYHKKCEKS